MKNQRVLLTGVTGFLGSHTTIQLLEKGYEVTGTLRSASRAASIKEIIGRHTKNIDKLKLVEADLTNENIWMELTRDIDFVQHIASPFPRELPKHENDLIEPAKRGTLAILKAASANKVKRVVLTSSIASVIYGKTKEQLDAVFSENDWTDENNKKDTTPYFRSKTIAEKAAWSFIEQDQSGLELATVLPGAILGPVLDTDFGTSANIVIKLFDGSTPALPNIGFDIIDVRSVADLLIKAMETPNAANNRYIASSGFLSFKEIAATMKKHYPNKKIPSMGLPNAIVRLYSNFDKTLKPVLLDLGIKRKLAITKAVNELNWQPLSAEEALVSCAKSIFEKGIVK